jgi:site-specific recombinase XerD
MAAALFQSITAFTNIRFRRANDQPVKSIKSPFKCAVELAGLEGKVRPPVLHHTTACWVLQADADKRPAAGFMGMRIELGADSA